MSRSTKPRLLYALILNVLLFVLLPASYMGAYYVMVDKQVTVYFGSQVSFKVFPDYRVSGPFTKAFFEPAHVIDRIIRSEYWSI